MSYLYVTLCNLPPFYSKQVILLHNTPNSPSYKEAVTYLQPEDMPCCVDIFH